MHIIDAKIYLFHVSDDNDFSYLIFKYIQCDTIVTIVYRRKNIAVQIFQLKN